MAIGRVVGVDNGKPFSFDKINAVIDAVDGRGNGIVEIPRYSTASAHLGLNQPAAWHYRGALHDRTYITYLDDASYWWVTFYDHDEQVWCPTPFQLGRHMGDGTNATYNGDTHADPILAIDNAGYIHVVLCPHMNEMRTRSSTNPEDISAFDAEQVLTTGYPASNKESYGKLIKDSDGNLHLFCRRTTLSPTTYHIGWRKGTVSGGNISWGSIQNLVTFASGSSPYFRVIQDGDRVMVAWHTAATYYQHVTAIYTEDIGATTPAWLDAGTDASAGTLPILNANLTKLWTDTGSDTTSIQSNSGVCSQAGGFMFATYHSVGFTSRMWYWDPTATPKMQNTTMYSIGCPDPKDEGKVWLTHNGARALGYMMWDGDSQVGTGLVHVADTVDGMHSGTDMLSSYCTPVDYHPEMPLVFAMYDPADPIPTEPYGTYTGGIYALMGGAGIGHDHPDVDAKLDHIFNLLPHVSPDDYAENTTPGTTDMSAAFQAAVNAVADGGVVYMGDGPYRLSTSVTLPVGATNKVRIVGNGSTVLKPDHGCFIHNGSANSICQHIEFGHFDIDGSVASGQVCMIGSWDKTPNPDTGLRTGWDDFYAHDIRITGLHTDQTNTDMLWGIILYAYHATSNEATATNLTNITMERIKMYGGNAGLAVFGSVSSGAAPNIWIDNVVMRDCVHELSELPVLHGQSTSFHIGSLGLVGSVRIDNCNSLNAGDNAIEVNNSLDTVISNCTGKNTWLGAITLGNYHALPDEKRQRIIIRNCNCIADGANDNIDTPKVNTPYGINLVSTNPNGHILVDGYRHEYRNSLGRGGIIFSCSSVSCESIILRNIVGYIDIDYTNDEANMSNNFINIINTKADALTLIDGVDIYVTGSVDGASYYSNYNGFILDGADANHVVRNVKYIFAVNHTGATSNHRAFFIGQTASSKSGVTFDNVFVASTIENMFGVRIDANNTLDATHPVIFGNGCDFTGCSTPFSNATAGNLAYVYDVNKTARA